MVGAKTFNNHLGFEWGLWKVLIDLDGYTAVTLKPEDFGLR